jgi:hypothetical protein
MKPITILLISSLMSVAAAHAADSSSPPSDAAASAPTSGVNFSQQLPATTRGQATETAKLGAGRTNPFADIGGFKPFPSGSAGVSTQKTTTTTKVTTKRHTGEGLVPPPPPTTSIGSFVPPPPASGGASQDLLNPNELPAPPDKPAIVGKMQLTGIVGSRALFTFDPAARLQNGWPKFVSLGAGEQFETVSVVNVSPDSVTLQEDGERTVKELPRIR